METSAWLAQVKEHQEKLRALVERYHPGCVQPRDKSLTITAPNAESTSEMFRVRIKRSTKSDPITDWDNAIANSNYDKIFNLISSTWLGVPESTDCWSLRGFSEAVDLLEDPPD